jgi:F0F1-type ATP synthase assembly protein I
VDLNERQEFYNGFGDSLARAFEFAATPAIFGFLGFLLDRAIGTLPVFVIIFSLLTLIGVFLKNWYAYDAAMKAHDAASPWGRARPPGSDGPQGS